MKRIAIVVNSIGIGGNERSALNIARCLKQFSDVRIIIQEDTGMVGSAGVPVYCMNTPPKNGFFGKAINSVVRTVKLYGYIFANRIDAVLLILPITNILNYLRYPCKKYISCRACGDLLRNTDRYAKMTEGAEAIVFNSHYMREYFDNCYPQLNNKGKTIHNILDFDNIMTSIQEELDNKQFEQFIEGKKVIVSVGRFCKEKALGNLIKSFFLLRRNYRDVVLVLIGDGVLKEKIERLISDLDLKDAVLLLGYQRNPYKYMSRCNVFALSSYSEGFPNVIPEAMACGLVVVSTDCTSGPREILAPTRELNKTTAQEASEYGILTDVFDNDDSEWDPQTMVEKHQFYAEALLSALKETAVVGRYIIDGRKRIDDFSIEKKIQDWRELFKGD